VLEVVVIISLVFVGCAKPTPASGPKEICMGFPAPLTGNLGVFGQGLAFGAKAAVDDINKQGGVYVKQSGCKLPVKLIVVDKESDQQR